MNRDMPFTPPPRRVLAVDYGARRVGLALSDPTGLLASPLQVIDAEPLDTLARRVASLAEEHHARLILVGLPRNMDGSLGAAADTVLTWVEELKQACSGNDCSIKTIDERMSTLQASRLLREAGRNAKAQKTRIDSASAQVLLQSYLDGVGS